jgi:hypothetical protein
MGVCLMCVCVHAIRGVITQAQSIFIRRIGHGGREINRPASRHCVSPLNSHKSSAKRSKKRPCKMCNVCERYACVDSHTRSADSRCTHQSSRWSCFAEFPFISSFRSLVMKINIFFNMNEKFPWLILCKKHIVYAYMTKLVYLILEYFVRLKNCECNAFYILFLIMAKQVEFKRDEVHKIIIQSNQKTV